MCSLRQIEVFLTRCTHEKSILALPMNEYLKAELYQKFGMLILNSIPQSPTLIAGVVLTD